MLYDYIKTRQHKKLSGVTRRFSATAKLRAVFTCFTAGALYTAFWITGPAAARVRAESD